MSKVYLYNYSFVDLLNLINYLINHKIKPDNIKNSDYFPNLLEETICFKIDEKEEIINNILKSVGPGVLKKMYLVFLSNNKNKELIIFYFYLNALKYKKNIIYMRNLKCVSETLRISSYVMHENHKLKGFLRFKELENKVLYAEIEPENDVLFMLSMHFQNRLKNEFWVIKDVRRGIISLYDKNKFFIISEDNFKISTTKISEREEHFEKMWKTFYETIGIKERKNDRCRMNFMPKKYWKYIIEVSDEYEKNN